eukprot:6211803-Pleurochrysis_carterae.AAC.1
MEDEHELCVFENDSPLQPSRSQITDKQYIESIFRRLSSLCRSQYGRFPAPNPVSMEMTHIQELQSGEYCASLKLDGVRHLLMMTVDKDGDHVAVMIDRAMRCYHVEMWGSSIFFTLGCVFDGELVWNYTNPQKPTVAYLIFDLLVYNGAQQTCKYTERLNITNGIILPTSSVLNTNEAIEMCIAEEGRMCAMNNENGLDIQVKHVVAARNMDDIWSKRLLSPFRTDGLIFTRDDHIPKAGTTFDIFKWKPEHTIDVGVRYCFPKCQLFLTSGYKEEIDISHKIEAGDNKPTLAVKLTQNALLNCIFMLFSAPGESDGHSSHQNDLILECICTIEGEALVLFPKKLRPDKLHAN